MAKLEGDSWTKCPLFLSFEELKKEHVLDVMKCALRPITQPVAEKPGRSRACMEAYNNLMADPYNMRYILHLGYIYANEGKAEKAANVMLRGWKRADEIEDRRVRFCFLMKLCELSYRINKPRQAFAVLNTIETPADDADLLVYRILSIQVYSAVGDCPKALSTFQKILVGMSYPDAVRVLALVTEDVRKAKIFHPLRDAVAALSVDKHQADLLSTVEHYVESKEKHEQNSKPPVDPKYITGVAVVIGVLFIVYLLYLLEQWSLRSWEKHRAAQK
eukprot:TRINITY_DN105616_c0_g1_i1.p1 TRINITY_DN105616_c0_g1~~TRINITY_DN105616_c0_g1_i1.p1  ORF type:complete len:275 (+),score=54.44 TRINITY_DN105616_c0_g1_i1:68-892(+)